MVKYQFEKPMEEGLIVKRKNRFIFIINLNNEIYEAHCPATGMLGDVVMENIPCLVSFHDDPKRKTRYTVEAISMSGVDAEDKQWIGINQVFSNRLMKYFLLNDCLHDIFSDVETVKSEVYLGDSRLDFKVNDKIYCEVKTPLTVFHVPYSDEIKLKKVKKYSPSDRFEKHLNSLAESLKENEAAYLFTFFQYHRTNPKDWTRSNRFDEVRKAVGDAVKNGVKFFRIECEYEKDGVSFLFYEELD